ncbi:MAG: hypothetical protein WD066_07525 [Planctomycetaceae bacterium]
MFAAHRVGDNYRTMDPQQLAHAANLLYVSDDQPGFRRIPAGRGFAYLSPNGRRITSARHRRRIEALVIPPAWTDVWICRESRGHLQATGRDDRGRKQYLYHPRWREFSNLAKFQSLERFARALPRVRRRIDRDLRRRALTREKTSAALVALLDTTMMRIGNEEYARSNGSFGLSTLRREHFECSRSGITLCFPGKSEREQMVCLDDARLVRIVREYLDREWEPVFQSLSADSGETPAPVGSQDVNEYLREISGEEISAKDFRTWKATALVAGELLLGEAGDTPAKRKRQVNAAIRAAAESLGNTTTVCRKYYVHPALTDAFIEGTLQPRKSPPSPRNGFTVAETLLLSVRNVIFR